MFNQHRVHRRKKIIFIPFAIAAFVLLLGWVVMLLWNAILPEILGVKMLNYWQAVGLLVLCRILFGSFGGGRRWRNGGRFDDSPRRHFGQNWMQMSDEERREMREAWRERCRKE